MSHRIQIQTDTMDKDMKNRCQMPTIYRLKTIRRRHSIQSRKRNQRQKKRQTLKLSFPLLPPTMECEVSEEDLVETPMMPQRSQSQSLSTNASQSCGDHPRSIILIVVQQICSDEYLSRDTCALAQHYIDQFIKKRKEQFEDFSDYELNTLVAASIGLAVRMNESIGLTNRKLSKIALVSAEEVEKYQLKLIRMMDFRLHTETYSSMLNEMLYEWDTSPLNIKKQCYFFDDQASYQRYRNICANIDEQYASNCFLDNRQAVTRAILESLGDNPYVREFLGYCGQPVARKAQKRYARHRQSIYPINYIEWVRLQVSIE